MESSADLVVSGFSPAQHVVGAEFEDQPVGALAKRPVEPGKTAGRGVARDAGVDD